MVSWRGGTGPRGEKELVATCKRERQEEGREEEGRGGGSRTDAAVSMKEAENT